MGVTIKSTIQESGDAIALLDKLGIELRGRSASKARKKAGNIAARRMRELAPRGLETGTTELLSAATKQKRGWPNKPLAETIRVADREAKMLTVVGPEYPAGAHGHLVEAGHEEVLWGKPTGRRVPPHPFARPAVDQTIEQQQQAMTASIMADVERLTNG